MGLWSWLFESLMGQGASDGTDAAPTQSPIPPPSEVSVATIDNDASPAAEKPETPADGWWRPQGEAQTEPVEIERPEFSHEARALENLLVQQFDGHDLTMPPLPRTPQRVLERLRNRNCDFARVADDIAEDQVVAAAVLRAVNSPFYRGAHEITSLQLAVARLGANALRTLMMHEALRATTFLQKSGSRQMADLIWRRSLSSACIMSGLSRFTDVNEEDAWLSGLLHDVGNVVVLRVLHGQRGFVDTGIDVDTFEYLCFECHQEFGELIADAWSLPPRLKALLSSHHVHPSADDPLRTERLMLQLTDMINAMLGYAPAASYDLLATRAARELGLSERRDLIDFLTDLPSQIEDAMIYF